MAEINKPLAADYAVIHDHYAHPPKPGGHPGVIISDAPSLARTADGALLCAVPLIIRGATAVPVDPLPYLDPLLFFRSEDGGRTWRKLPAESQFCSGTLLPHDDALYFIGTGPGHRRAATGLRVIRSLDNGFSWSKPVDIFRGPFYQPATGYVIRENTFYWCADTGRDTTYAIAADLGADLADPAAWRISAGLRYPGTPPSLTTGDRQKFRWLEGNVVDVRGRLRACWRLSSVDGLQNMAIICDLEDDGKKLDYRFVQFHPWPGAQNHFHVVHDPVEGLYWMTANLPDLPGAMIDQARYPGMGGRRTLALFCSFDALNWLPAGYVIVWPLVRQASNYCGLLIDGDDLLVAARTSRAGRSHHDNDLTTFHRVKNFRALATFLQPGEENDAGT